MDTDTLVATVLAIRLGAKNDREAQAAIESLVAGMEKTAPAPVRPKSAPAAVVKVEQHRDRAGRTYCTDEGGRVACGGSNSGGGEARPGKAPRPRKLGAHALTVLAIDAGNLISNRGSPEARAALLAKLPGLDATPGGVAAVWAELSRNLPSAARPASPPGTAAELAGVLQAAWAHQDGGKAPAGGKPARKPAQKEPEFTEAEREALGMFSVGGAFRINAALRENFPIPGERLQNMDRQMQSAFAKVPPLEEPKKVYRGMSMNPANLAAFAKTMQKHKKSGEPYTSVGYVSTTTLAEDVKDAQVSITIDARHGIDMVPHSKSPQEAEFLLNRGSRFRVLDVKKREDGGLHVELEQLPDEKTATQPALAPAQPKPASTGNAGNPATLARTLEPMLATGHGSVDLADLKDKLGWTVPQLHEAIDKLRRAGAISLAAYEGRHGISERQREVAVRDETVPGQLPRQLGLVEVKDPEKFRQVLGGKSHTPATIKAERRRDRRGRTYCVDESGRVPCGETNTAPSEQSPAKKPARTTKK